MANALFADQGITFARDDGEGIPISDWTAQGRQTTSPDLVIATIKVPGISSTWVTHLEVISSSPLSAIGASFGNDQILSFLPAGDFASIRMSVFGPAGEPLGAVEVAANHNTSIDQFIGASSDVRFHRVRFENLEDTGAPAGYYSVVLDDLVFVPVPEPSAGSLVGLGLLALAPWLHPRSTRLTANSGRTFRGQGL